MPEVYQLAINDTLTLLGPELTVNGVTYRAKFEIRGIDLHMGMYEVRASWHCNNEDAYRLRYPMGQYDPTYRVRFHSLNTERYVPVRSIHR